MSKMTDENKAESKKKETEIESAVVRYADKSKEELLALQIRDEIFSCYTTPDNVFQLGIAGY